MIEDRNVLEEGAVVAPRNQPDSTQLPLDVRRRFEVVRRAHLAAHHGVVGEEVEPRHQIGRRNRRNGRLRCMLERELGLLRVDERRACGRRGDSEPTDTRERHAVLQVGVRAKTSHSAGMATVGKMSGCRRETGIRAA